MRKRKKKQPAAPNGGRRAEKPYFFTPAAGCSACHSSLRSESCCEFALRFFAAYAPQNDKWGGCARICPTRRPYGPMPSSARLRCFRLADFFSLRRGNTLRGPLLSARAERRGRKARQREGLFTKPPFPLESHPPKFVCPPRLTLLCALPRSARPAQSRRCGKCRKGLHRTSACGYAEIISFVILSEAKNLVSNLL